LAQALFLVKSLLGCELCIVQSVEGVKMSLARTVRSMFRVPRSTFGTISSLPLLRGCGSNRTFCGYRGPAEVSEERFPDSWVEPEALWSFAEGHDKPKDIDAEFESEFGRRNEQWREKMLREDPFVFDTLGAGQSPKYLWIGCSDSRVAAENLIAANPGELFVHRNIANMVVATDTNFRSVLQYAVDYLEVEHIIVCGHYECGGLRAAVKHHDHRAPLESWLANARDVVRLHTHELEAIIDEDEKHKRLVELNVIEQCLNLFKTGDVQRRRAMTSARPDMYASAFPRIHGMVFSPGDGILRRLPIDFAHYLAKYKHVYKMHDRHEYK